MADSYPTLTLAFDLRSRLSTTPNITETRFGDGFVQRVARGVNNLDRTYSIVQRTCSLAESDTLREFLEDNGQGQEVDIPLLNIDPTGATTSLFYIQNWQQNPDQTALTHTFTITAVEV